MKQEMLINAVHPEQKRMAIVEDGKLIEFDIQMSFKEPTTGNIYKGKVQKVERGLQAAFVTYGGKKDGFLPLRDISQECFTGAIDKESGQGQGRPILKIGQELLVQVVREATGQKGALLTGFISLPGRYLVLLPKKESSGVSRKIDDEGDRKRLKEIVEQLKTEEDIGFIVRTAGMNRTKQELARDYQHLLRLWEEIQKKEKDLSAPALIYQESDFGVRSLRDYFTPEITQILVDDAETFKKMRAYLKAITPRNLKMIAQYKEKTSIFDRYQLEEQIRSIYQDRVLLKSGGSLVIKPTEAMITIDVNSGRGSHKRNVEETAFKTNMEAAEEVARQLRLRDLGGLIVIDFIDMMDRQNIAEVEKTFKKAMSIDRARIQMARISKFGIMELSRQKKHSTIQEISYVACPYCHGSGIRPSLEYIALSAFRKIESQAVKGSCSILKVSLHDAVANYLLNQKRSGICHLETQYEMAINIEAVPGMAWDAINIETTRKPGPVTVDEGGTKSICQLEEQEIMEEEEEEASAEEDAIFPEKSAAVGETPPTLPDENVLPLVTEESLPKKKTRRRRRNRHRKPAAVTAEALVAASEAEPLLAELPGAELPAPVLPAVLGLSVEVPDTSAEFKSEMSSEETVPAPKSRPPRRRKKKLAQPVIVSPSEEESVVKAAQTEPESVSEEPLVNTTRKPTPVSEIAVVGQAVDKVANESAMPVTPVKAKPARRRKPRTVKLPLLPETLSETASETEGPTTSEQDINQKEVVMENEPVEPPKKKRRPAARRKPGKVKEELEANSSEGEDGA